MLLTCRPFKVGDYVEVAGKADTVKELNLFFTELTTPDNIRITVLNSQVWGGALNNFSANPERSVDIVAGNSYDDYIDKAMEVLQNIVDQDSRVLKDPETFIGSLVSRRWRIAA